MDLLVKLTVNRMDNTASENNDKQINYEIMG